MELHTQSKKEVIMGKLSYLQKLKYLEPLPISCPLLHCDFLNWKGWKKHPRNDELFYMHTLGVGCSPRKEKPQAPKNAYLGMSPDQRQFPLSLNSSTYLWTSWGKNSWWCVDAHCILNRYMIRILSEDTFLSQQNPTLRECFCNC